jgi:hypothetical protein
MSAAGNHLATALVLYEWDTHAAAALVQTAALAEVVVRNTLDREMDAWAAKRGKRS